VITRRRFLADKEESKKHPNAPPRSNKSSKPDDSDADEETTPLKTSSKKSGKDKSYDSLNNKSEIDESVDFFPLISEEMTKVNNFFIGKLATLKLALEDIVNERRNSYRSHHTSSESAYLTRLRDIYVELAALRSFCELNKTGFYKIIKKYDKVMGEKNLEMWTKILDKQHFADSVAPLELMDTVTGFVSRDKLIEWERFATEQHNKSSDDILSGVRFLGFALSSFVFLASLALPMVIPNDPAASRCLSLLLFVVFLWVTEAIPYFATAMIIPILVIVMGVLKNPQDPTKPMTAEAAATFVTDHIFNHTTYLLLGGYTLSTAFSRCQLELRFASILQNHLGKNPKQFILAIMFLGLFLSMWISNHTAPILCATIILPIVRDLPTDSR
jgi:phosphate transporter